MIELNLAVKWGYVLPISSLTNLSEGDRIGVQFCLNVGTRGATPRVGTLFFENGTSSFMTIPFDYLDNPPDLTLISPENSSYLDNQTVYFSANFTDDLHLKNSTIYLFNSTNSLINTTSRNISGLINSTNISISLPYQGIFKWNYYVCDNQNHCLFNNLNFTFIYDSISPTINFTAPADTSGSYVSRNYILANVTSTDTNFNNITIFLYNSTRNLINSTNSSTSPLYINFSGLSDGIYYLNATAYDLAGNVNNTETRNVTIHVTNPSINFTSPTDTSGSYVSRNYILANVTAVDSVLKNITIFLYNSTRNLINSINSSTSPLYINFSGLSDGIYYLNATAYDFAGNVNNTETRNITLDRVPPVITVISPIARVYNTTQILINFTATDNLDGFSLWFYNETRNVTYTSPITLNLSESSHTFFFIQMIAQAIQIPLQLLLLLMQRQHLVLFLLIPIQLVVEMLLP